MSSIQQNNLKSIDIILCHDLVVSGYHIWIVTTMAKTSTYQISKPTLIANLKYYFKNNRMMSIRQYDSLLD